MRKTTILPNDEDHNEDEISLSVPLSNGQIVDLGNPSNLSGSNALKDMDDSKKEEVVGQIRALQEQLGMYLKEIEGM